MGLSVSALTFDGIGSLGREVQAAYLLDQVLVAMKIADLEVKLSSLSRIDSELQLFLGVLLHLCHGGWGVYCGSVSITIRYVDVSFGLGAA